MTEGHENETANLLSVGIMSNLYNFIPLSRARLLYTDQMNRDSILTNLDRLDVTHGTLDDVNKNFIHYSNDQNKYIFPDFTQH